LSSEPCFAVTQENIRAILGHWRDEQCRLQWATAPQKPFSHSNK
jgi:hypothetical protein